MKKKRILLVSSAVLCALILSACQAMEVQKHSAAEQHHSLPQEQPKAAATEKEAVEFNPAGLVLDLRNTPGLPDIMPELSRQRVIFVGESHTTYGHHLSQLEIIRRLHEMDLDVAIGMEFFQQPFQSHLDAYVAGTLDEKGMLLKTEYFDRWAYDYRLYRPILNYAREHGIPIVALNLPKEITRKVADHGMGALTDEETAQLPADIDDSDPLYRKHMREVFYQHPHSNNQDFERFLQVQMLWDEGMAQRASDYLVQHPEKRMVVLAGSGHVTHGYGIPKRLTRRLPMDSVIVLPANGLEIVPGMGDFLLYPEKTTLPPKGMMGVLLGDDDRGVRITGVVPGSAASKVGVRKDDLILSLKGEVMRSVAEVKVAMLDSNPGDKVHLVIRRKRFLLGEKELSVEMELGQ